MCNVLIRSKRREEFVITGREYYLQRRRGKREEKGRVLWPELVKGGIVGSRPTDKSENSRGLNLGPAYDKLLSEKGIENTPSELSFF